MRNLGVGDYVKVAEGSGIFSRRIGRIVRPSTISTDGRGILRLAGHYKPPDWRKEVLILGDNGEVFTMYRDRLEKVGS